MADVETGSRFAGRWWLAGNAEHLAHATLAIEDGRAELAVTEPVTPDWYAEHVNAANMVVRVAAVHGEAEGSPFTLLDCDLPITIQTNARITCDADAVLQGVHVASRDTARFDEVAFVVENLAVYAGESGLRVGIDGQVVTPAREPVNAEVTDTLTVSMVWTMSRSSSNTANGWRLIVEDSVHFDARCAGLVSVQEIRRIERRLCDFVTFATGAGSVATSRVLTGPVSSDGERTPGDRVRAQLTETSSFAAPKGQSRPLGALLELDDIPWIDLAPRWFALYDDFRPIIGTLVGHRYLPAHFIENRALNLVIAAEQTYRALGLPDVFISDKDLSKGRKAIRKAVGTDENVPEFLPAVLDDLLAQLHNRVTLDARLRGIVAYVGPAAATLLGGNTAIEWWIVAAKRSRNDLGHTGHTSQYGVAALAAIAKATEALLELVIVKRLGGDEALLAKVVERRHWRIAALVSGHLQPAEQSDGTAANLSPEL